MDLTFVCLLLLAYLSGSISSAVLVCKVLTLPDPRIVGSKNPGATNVHRIGGKSAALATLIGDLLKTGIPIGLAIMLGYSQGQIGWIGVCALIGHCFPIYFKLQGGKGVASMFAILLLVVPSLMLLAVVSWLILAWTFKRSSVASIITATTVPIFAFYFAPATFMPLVALCVVVVLRHRNNIINIIAGNEPIIGDKSSRAKKTHPT